MKRWAKQRQGFTIVELLIVIVVIAILAAITIVAFNGIQDRAKNTQTIQGVTSWVKAIKLYYAENNSWPTDTSCLGGASSYVGDNGYCWSSGAYTVNTTFLDQLAPYNGGNVPTVNTDKLMTSSTEWIKGGRYQGTTHSIYFILRNLSTCPKISGLDNSYAATYPSFNAIQCGGAIL